MSYAVEVNEGVIDASSQGATWWHTYRIRYAGTSRIVETVSPCIVGGKVEVACDDRKHADWLAAHMVEHGGLPKAAVKVVRRADRDGSAW